VKKKQDNEFADRCLKLYRFIVYTYMHTKYTSDKHVLLKFVKVGVKTVCITVGELFLPNQLFWGGGATLFSNLEGKTKTKKQKKKKETDFFSILFSLDEYDE